MCFHHKGQHVDVKETTVVCSENNMQNVTLKTFCKKKCEIKGCHKGFVADSSLVGFRLNIV